MPGLSCGGGLALFVVLTRCANVFLHLKAIFIPVCLNRLVIFLMFGDLKVKVAHFSFLLGCVGVTGGGGLSPFMCHAIDIFRKPTTTDTTINYLSNQLLAYARA